MCRSQERGAALSDLLSWRDDWCTGIDWVDTDHREMAVRLNRLADACCRHSNEPSDQPGRSLVLERLDALIAHNRIHFKAEETFLREIAYPGYEEHRREHQMQLAEFMQLRRALSDAPEGTLEAETLEDFKRWFFDHVIAEDRAYADYYRTASARRTPGG